MIRFGSLSPVEIPGQRFQVVAFMTNLVQLPWSNVQKPKLSWADLLRSKAPPVLQPMIVSENIPDNRSTLTVVPRGLINEGNLCFMNSMLQPLVFCPPFVDTILSLQQELDLHSKNTPLLRSMSIFLNEFLQDKNHRKQLGPFTPEYVYDTLRTLKEVDSIKGRQEDAAEFLGFLLNGLHDELLKGACFIVPHISSGSPDPFSNS
jgi:ubiquitin C-terminal hydrolase